MTRRGATTGTAGLEFGAVLGRLRGLREVQPGKWEAHCPAHEDERPSLGVRVGYTGSLVLRCHAPCHCPTDSILKALGLRVGDLYTEQQRTEWRAKMSGQQGRVAKVYQYRDGKGRLAFEVCRTEPKGFRQRRPNPQFDPAIPPDRETNPEFVYNLEGVQRVPYRLPDLIDARAKNPNRIVLVVEGEKDVDLAWTAGIAATCNPMGAGKWRDEYSEWLAGCNVVVIADNDDPGRDHAQEVAASVAHKAKTVKVVACLPGVGDKGDLSDWWAAQTGGNDDRKKKLAAYINGLPLYSGTPAPAPAPQPGVVPAGTTPGGTPNTKPAAEKPDPKPAPKPAEPAPPAQEVSVPAGGTQPGEGATDAESIVRDIRESAEALGRLGCRARSVAELYGAIRMMVGEIDAAVGVRDNELRLDYERFRQAVVGMAAFALVGLPDLDKTHRGK